jgi:hypothetical protein
MHASWKPAEFPGTSNPPARGAICPIVWGNHAQVLLTSVFDPYAQDDEYGSHQQKTGALTRHQRSRTQSVGDKTCSWIRLRKMTDEPLLESAPPGKSSGSDSTEDHALRDQVAHLVQEQPYAVLCTQGGGALLERWKRIYWDEFIPFAHGVRYLGMYFNDAVHPQDPYEFVGLLRGEDMLASQRNRLLQVLAQQVQESSELQRTLQQAVHAPSATSVFEWEAWASQLSAFGGGCQFLEAFQTLLCQFMDVAFGGLRLIDNPAPLLPLGIVTVGVAEFRLELE